MRSLIPLPRLVTTVEVHTRRVYVAATPRLNDKGILAVAQGLFVNIFFYIAAVYCS